MNKKLYVIWHVKKASFDADLKKTKAILEGPVDYIQYRNKEDDFEEALRKLQYLKILLKGKKTKLIINDSLPLMKAISADGLHIGQEDGDISQMRREVGKKILGVTAKTVAQALEAQKKGADYLGVGAIFPSKTKPQAKAITKETVAQICKKVNLPCYLIGGIRADNLSPDWLFLSSGIVVSEFLYGGNAPKERLAQLTQAMKKHN